MLNRRGNAWRWFLVISILALAAAPALPLAVSAVGQASARPLWTPSFAGAVRSSLLLGAGVTLAALVIGLPLGLLAALYRFHGRSVLVLCQAVPLLLPSFLPCIGWSNLATNSWFAWLPAPGGWLGCMWVLGLQAMPLAFFATWAACLNLTASQIDAARLFGGEQAVLWLAVRACGPVALFAAMLGGILSLSDPGAPLILGYRCVAVEILTSFSALYDYDLASRQCLLLAGLVLLLTAPVVIVGLPSLAAAILARQVRPTVPYPHRVLGSTAQAGLIAALLLGLGFPTLGLCLPAAANPMLSRAADKVAATAPTTLVFTIGAGAVAVVLATVISLASREDRRLRLLALAWLLVMLALPPALAGIGVSRTATAAPAELDWLLRSRLTVVLALGLRFLPLATVASLRAVGSLSPSWIAAAQVHGVARHRFFLRVILLYLSPTLVISLLLVAVLAAADITTTHFLQPPGKQSLPVAIFTVMANSPEGLVASLCLLYLSVVALLLSVAAMILRARARRAA